MAVNRGDSGFGTRDWTLGLWDLGFGIWDLPFRIGRFNLLDDEEFLPWADETELPAGDGFDGVGVLTQFAGLFAKPRVLRPRPLQRRFKGAVLLPRLEHGEESSVADESVDDQYAADRHHEVTHNPAAAPPRERGSLVGVGGGLFHEIVAAAFTSGPARPWENSAFRS